MNEEKVLEELRKIKKEIDGVFTSKLQIEATIHINNAQKFIQEMIGKYEEVKENN